jgi:hypothetical protein
MRIPVYLALLGLIGLTSAVPPDARAAGEAPRRKEDLAAQFARLTSLWPGVYDNNEQIVRQSGGGLGLPASAPFHRLRSIVTAVSRPDLGERVLELRQFRDNDPSRVVRHQMLVPAIDAVAGGIRVRRIDVAPAPGPGSGASRPAAPPPCDLLLYWEGTAFRGAADPGCPGRGRDASREEAVLGPREYWQREVPAGPGWFEQTRARDFRCVVNHSADGDMTRTKRLATIDVDDQGGEADIAWPDGRTLTFIVHRRAFNSPPDREFVLYRIHEKGRHVPLAYAYAEDTATRFGLNLGWFYILCAPRDATPPGPG